MLPKESAQPSQLIVVSNRLPLTLEPTEHGEWQATPSSGGLVSALVPILQARGGTWIGWPGSVEASEEQVEQALERVRRDYGCVFKPVTLSQAEVEGFYFGFSNEIIWPLFHDLFTACNFRRDYWESYQAVNRRFADAVAEVAAPGDFVWVHDYHLMDLARDLRMRGCNVRTGFFLHTPFPPLEIFLKLPWRFEILRNLLEFESLGFQTPRDRRNFQHCVQSLLGVRSTGGDSAGAVVQLHVPARSDEHGEVPERTVYAASFPVGIDYRRIASAAEGEAVRRRAQELRARFNGRRIILGVDRLDYTKGLPNRLEAFRNALHRYPQLRGRVNLVQHVVPSRGEIPDYQQLRLEIERLVGEINGEFTDAGWVPIHYMFHSLDFEELLSYYAAADIALVTSLKDGMNLVAKEYCAAQWEEEGVLILSEFAGAAAQLQHGALLINPHDVYGTADAIYSAFQMPPEERRERMRTLRRIIRMRDVYHWADDFLRAAAGRSKLVHVPAAEDYLPRAKF